MNQRRTVGLIALNLIMCLVVLVGCGGVEKKINFNEEKVDVSVGVARTGGLLTGLGKMNVFVDGRKVFIVKNNDTVYQELKLYPGVHSIQVKGQGDKSKEKAFKVVAGKENSFVYTAEISNWYGIKIERIE